MDIKDFKNAMDNLPMGDGGAFAEIEVGPSKHEQFLDNHYGKLALGLFVCIMGVAGWIIYHQMNKTMQKEAGAELVQAVEFNEQSGEMKVQAAGLDKVLADYPSSNAATTASYLKVIELWNTGKDQEGCEAMQNFISSTDIPEWKALASTALAGHYRQNGDMGKAREWYQVVADSANPVYAPFALISLGDIARAAGDKKAAGDYYKQVSELYPESALMKDDLKEAAGNGYGVRKLIFDVDSPTPIQPTSAK